MKTKTDAAKILMDAGWTFEDVQAVLGSVAIRGEVPPYITATPLKPWQQPTIVFDAPTVWEHQQRERPWLTPASLPKDLPPTRITLNDLDPDRLADQ
jgi:hypothetical protein